MLPNTSNKMSSNVYAIAPAESIEDHDISRGIKNTKPMINTKVILHQYTNKPIH